MGKVEEVATTSDGSGEFGVDFSPLFQKLKPGPGLTSEQVLADQRDRLRSAVISLVADHGWHALRVRSVARTAGVSSASFYRSFSNVDECLASAHEATIAGVVNSATAAQHRGDAWRDSLAAVIATSLEQLAAHPEASQVALVDAFSAGPLTRRRIPLAFAEIEEVLARSFETAPDPPPAPRHLIAGMTAGMLRIARRTALSKRLAELPCLADALTDWMVSLPRLQVVSLLVRPAGIRRREPHPIRVRADEPERLAGDRECLLRAASRLGAAEGYASLTPARIRAEAGVSRRRFDESFSGVDDCFLDSISMVATEGAARASAWAMHADGWARQTCRFVLALSAQAARDRRLARLAFIDIFAVGSEGLVRREELVTLASEQLRATVPANRRPPALFAEASVAAAWHIAQADIASSRAKGLPKVAPLLSYFVLAPIIGPSTAVDAARAEPGWN